MTTPEILSALEAKNPSTAWVVQTANAMEVDAATTFDRAKALPTKHYLQREKRDAMLASAVQKKMLELAMRELIERRQRELRLRMQSFPDMPGHVPGTPYP